MAYTVGVLVWKLYKYKIWDEMSVRKCRNNHIRDNFLSLLTRDIDIAILSVRLSVTRWYCMKTA